MAAWGKGRAKKTFGKDLEDLWDVAGIGAPRLSPLLVEVGVAHVSDGPGGRR